jgi:hypothetical protein
MVANWHLAQKNRQRDYLQYFLDLWFRLHALSFLY